GHGHRDLQSGVLAAHLAGRRHAGSAARAPLARHPGGARPRCRRSGRAGARGATGRSGPRRGGHAHLAHHRRDHHGGRGVRSRHPGLHLPPVRHRRRRRADRVIFRFGMSVRDRRERAVPDTATTRPTTRKTLNSTAASLLGFLHEGPMSGWDLVTLAQDRIGDFWTITQSQVYRELATMAASGLVEKGETGARDRTPYRLTDAGRAAFLEWVVRDPGA